MGQRNPDRVPLSARRARCETVAQMLQQRWEVTGRCKLCHLELRADLRTIAIVRGPGFSLWNRNSRCRRIAAGVRCAGIVQFYAKAPGMSGPELLMTPNIRDDEPPAWLRSKG